ncbi:MAG: DNA mismatch repair protein MutS [Acidimicrobiales bacterium]|nr:Smr/MutS family protein [Hyphomonadaceae bacterium]RZV44682.1 MAG: DNA mismatch repair protein MutS [Acidimicrobiales bacterium]
MKPKRPLSEEDLQIWQKVARTVQPLDQAGRQPVRPSTPPHVHISPAPKPIRRIPKGELALNGDKLVRRGRVEINQKIDLHDLTRDQAFPALLRRLTRAHAAGARCVLVVTGKGPNLEGVLRKSLPGWLMDPHIRPIVASFAEAHIKHGGSGAFYVFLKRKRR